MYNMIWKNFLLCLRQKNPCLHVNNNNKQSLEQRVFEKFAHYQSGPSCSKAWLRYPQDKLVSSG